MEPLPNVNRVFSVLLKERQITRGTIFDGNVVNTTNAQGHFVIEFVTDFCNRFCDRICD